MDPRALLHPMGPLPASVYWTRRALVVGLPVLVLVVVIVLLAGSGGAAHPGTTPSSGRSPTVGTTAASSPGGPASSVPTSRSVSPSTPVTRSTAALNPSAPCVPTAVALVVRSSAATYPTGADPVFSATASTPGSACLLAGPVSFVVVSGTDRVWSNTDCTPAPGPATQLHTHGSVSASRTWTRARSVAACGKVDGSQVALPGHYEVTAHWAGVTSVPIAFALS